MSNPDTLSPPWEKGESGNPEGRPKGSKNFTTKVREALEKISEGGADTAEVALIKAILKNAIDKGDVTAQKMIWSYLDGMPTQKTDLTSGGEKIQGFNFIQPETNNSNEIND